MKILQIINTLGPGGAEKLVSQLSSELNNRNVNTSVYVLRKTTNVFFHKQLEKNKLVLVFSKRKSFYDLRHVFDLLIFVKKTKPDIVHAHLSFALYYTAMLRLLLYRQKIAYFYTEHSTANRRRRKNIFKLFDRLIYSSYHRIICISDDVKANLDEWLNMRKSRSITVYNGINTSLFRKAQPLSLHEIGLIKTSDKILICVGSMFPHKNQQIIIKALSRLDENHKLILVGDGPLKQELEKLTCKLKLQERVFFLGVRSDVERIYKICDLFVLSSTREGFGLVAAEAMASGIPVLVSDIPGIKKIVGEFGYKFKVDDIDDLTANITYIINNQEEVKERVKKSISYVEQFSIDKMIAAYLKNYKCFISE